MWQVLSMSLLSYVQQSQLYVSGNEGGDKLAWLPMHSVSSSSAHHTKAVLCSRDPVRAVYPVSYDARGRQYLPQATAAMRPVKHVRQWSMRGWASEDHYIPPDNLHAMLYQECHLQMSACKAHEARQSAQKQWAHAAPGTAAAGIQTFGTRRNQCRRWHLDPAVPPSSRRPRHVPTPPPKRPIMHCAKTHIEYRWNNVRAKLSCQGGTNEDAIQVGYACNQ